MKQIRKRIGVVVSDVQLDYQKEILKGIAFQAKEIGCDVFFFSNINNVLCEAELRKAEEKIYSLAFAQRLDGLLYKPNDFTNKDIQATLDARLRSLEIPILCVDDKSDVFPYLLPTEDRKWFSQLTMHFIKKHGHKKIYCLTGPEGSMPAQERLAGYRDAMEQSGLRIAPGYERFGDFWIESAKEFAMDIIQGKVDWPDAVVCASDMMALSLLETFQEHAICVPEQIAIGGFDNGSYGKMSNPTLTTAANPSYNLGVRSVCRLYEMMTGKNVSPTSLQNFTLSPGGSCTCNVKRNLVTLSNRLTEREKRYHGGNMTLSLAGTNSLRDSLRQVDYYRFLLGEDIKVMLCLCSDWDSDDSNSGENDYSKTMLLETYEGTESFLCSDLLPPSMNREPPTAYYCLPLFYTERRFGYLVMYTDDPCFVPEDAHCIWSSWICTALETIRMKNYIVRLRSRVMLTELRDALTGLFTLQGLEQQAIALFDRAEIKDMSLLVIYADIDGLRQLNDNYGHSEGDVAITVSAQAMAAACTGGEICARIGGGTFALLGCGNYTMERLESMIFNIRQSYSWYNNASGKEYQISLSIGSSVQSFNRNTTLFSILNQAKQDMFLDKQQHRIHLKAPYHHKLNEIRNRIYATPRMDWQIEMLARETQVSVSYFRRLYREQFNCGFTTDVIASRVALAKRLLADTSMSIAKIASECGYQTEDYFMRQFKKETGSKPTEYRHMQQEKAKL